ncbi:MAG: 2-dehydropantoate 2-reductase [Thermoproteota archaeon]|nr:2-dehydropantoate 2-reductase [Thermoproteota archaeon]
MSFQQILVLGAGAVGSSYGALLSRKNNVTLIGNAAHIQAINSDGLILSGDSTGNFAVKAQTKTEDIPSDTLLLLTTKAYDLASATVGIRDLLKKDTVILILQNGLGIKELVEGIVGNDIEVVRGLAMIGAEFPEPGKIIFRNGETILEPTKTAERIGEMFNGCGLKTRISKQFHEEVWGKLVMNCVVNPLTAIFQVRNNEIGANSLMRLRHMIMEECVRVGKAEGIKFKPNLKESIGKKILGYKNFSSMCQDLMKRKKTEIDFLNGKIVELGKKHGVPTPINEALVCMVKFLEGK